MFGAREWKIIYNDVFRVFPSPDNIPMKIILKDNKVKKTFSSSSELIAYMCLNKNISISNDNIEYILEDANLRSEVENEIHILDDKIKERF